MIISFMGNFQKKWLRAREVFYWKEIRVFWLFVPLAALVFIIGFFYLPLFYLVIVGGLLLAIALIVFWSAYRAGRLNRETGIERSELESIVLGLNDALVAYDRNFKILFFNPAAEKIFNLDKDLVVGKEIGPQNVENPAMRLLAQVIFPSLAPTMISRSPVGVFPQAIDLSFTEPTLELRTTTDVIKDGKGNLLGFMKIIHNQTRELELVKSKNEFITIASHQLRTPINQIKWTLDSLGQDKALSPDSQKILEMATGSADQLLKIVDDLLDIAKMEEGRFGYNFVPTDLSEFIGKILTEVAPQAQHAGVKVYLDRPKELVSTVNIDPQKLSLALDNLLDNAIRYNVQNGEVIIRIEKQKDKPFVEISVRDTGIGIPSDSVNRLFTKFFRAENASKTQAGGSGLGLYIAKNIVQAHGGQIWAESELNRGTTFHFTIPTDPNLVPSRETGLMDSY